MKRALALSLVATVSSLATPGCAPNPKPCNELKLRDELLFTVTDIGQGDYCDPATAFGLRVEQELRFVVQDFYGNKQFADHCLSAAGPIETDWLWDLTYGQAGKTYPFDSAYTAAKGECTGDVDVLIVPGGFADVHWYDAITYEPTPADLGIDLYPTLGQPGCMSTECFVRASGTVQKIKK